MKSLWFTKRGENTAWWRCGVCKTDVQYDPRAAVAGDPVIMVMVGNQCLALVCSACVAPTVAAVSAVAPHSFPDLDDIGQLL